MRTKRVAIVGLGKMGILHASIVNAMPDAKVVAVSDKQKGLKNQVVSMGIKGAFYESLEDLLARESIDAVIACVPSSVNVYIAKICAARKVSLFLEKPLANNLENALSIYELGKSSGIKNAVGYSVAHIPTFAKAAEIVKDGMIGKIVSTKAKAYLSAVFSKQSTWQYNKRVAGGGCMMAIGSHLLFIMKMILGMPVKVKKAKLNYKYNEVEDEADIEMEYKDGSEAKIDVSWSIHGYQDTLFELEIEGTKGIMIVNNNEILIYSQKKKEQKESAPVLRVHSFQLKENTHFNLGGPGYGAQDLEFIQSLGNVATAKSDWLEGLNIQQILHSIYESSENKGPVAIHEIIP